MIYFITKRPEFHKIIDEIEIIETKTDLEPQELVWLEHLPIIGFDLETNDLDPYAGEILLVILGNKETQYVFDAVSYNCKHIFDRFLDNKVYLTANGKFDYKFIKVKYNKSLKKIFDVMIAEQRLVQGTGYSASLQSIIERRLNIIMNKDVRSEFIGVNPTNFIFKNKHIVYGAGDIDKLFDIRDRQKEKIAMRDQQFLIYHIEFPLIRILGDMELEGINLNEEKWRENIKSNKDKRFESELILDKELKTLRDNICIPENRKFITGGKWDRVRNRYDDIVSENLFGELFEEIEVNLTAVSKKKPKVQSPFINYSSTDILLNIFGRLNQPAPTQDPKTKESGPYTIPEFIWKTTTNAGRYIINKMTSYPYRFTTGAGSIESYLIENPHVPIKSFVKELIKYRKYCTRINTFGESFITKYKSKITHKFHTIYRQCHAITGRLQSGDRRHGYYNSQNIPKEKEYRQCFYSIDPETGIPDNIDTTDLSGAEAVIVIDKAKDEVFKEIHIEKDDSHGVFATRVWNAIGNYRLEIWDNKENHNKTPEQLSIIKVSKKENKDIRTLWKNCTFAIIYRAGKKKVAKMINVSVEESTIAIDIMKNTIPKTFRMINNNVKFALTHGYLILNERTNSRIWYPEVLNAVMNNQEVPGHIIHEVTNSAANSPIQGTQADMLKEAMVEIYHEAERQDLIKKYRFMILLQVHDELVTRHNNKEVLVEFKNDNKTIEMVTISEFTKKWIIQVSNRYLSYLQMNAEQESLLTWTK